MTALLISEIGNYQQTSKYIAEANRLGIEVLPPDINKSQKQYSIYNGKILFGLESIKGVGEKAVEEILLEREKGEYKSLEDFISRCKLDSSSVIALIKSGCFGTNKNELLLKYASYTMPYKSSFKPIKTLPPKKKLIELGIIKEKDVVEDKESLLKKLNELKEREFNEQLLKKRDEYLNNFKEKYMSTPEMYEYETLSIFINGSPFEKIKHYFKSFDEYPDGNYCYPIGTITSVKRKKQKNGATMAYIELLTPDKMIEGLVFAKQYAEYQDILKKGSNIIVKAKKSGEQFIVEKIKTLEQWKRERNII